MKKSIIFLIFCVFINAKLGCEVKNVQFINKGDNALLKLNEFGLVSIDKPLRLHLGCGENYFDGYVNIDFPSSEHTFQQKTIANVYADITILNFPENSVNEVRSHHVFEHFERPISMALLCNWSKWLKVGGCLVIETPDFEESVKLFCNPNLSYEAKQMILRHVFGSHEARWAVHCDGWYQEKFASILGKLGFSGIRFQKGGGLIKNILVIAYKDKNFDLSQLSEIAKKILQESLVDPIEVQLHNVWCTDFDKYFYI